MSGHTEHGVEAPEQTRPETAGQTPHRAVGTGHTPRRIYVTRGSKVAASKATVTGPKFPPRATRVPSTPLQSPGLARDGLLVGGGGTVAKRRSPGGGGGIATVQEYIKANCGTLHCGHSALCGLCRYLGLRSHGANVR